MISPEIMVGPSRLELPTSRLSGARSNLLSYGPISAASAPHSHEGLRDPGGDDEARTHDPLLAKQVLSQLSYTPVFALSRFRPGPSKLNNISRLCVRLFTPADHHRWLPLTFSLERR